MRQVVNKLNFLYFMFFYIFIISSSYAKQPLFISNIETSEEAEKITNKTKFELEDYFGHWLRPDFKKDMEFYKESSFNLYGSEKFFNCSIVEKGDNRLFMKCSITHNKKTKDAYAKITLNYYNDYYHFSKEKNLAYLNIGVEVHNNLDCFKNDNNLSYKECHLHPYNNYFGAINSEVLQ